MPQWDRIDVDGSPMRLYVGMPSLGRAFPAVIVVHHGPGVDKFIEDRVENLAQRGYLAPQAPQHLGPWQRQQEIDTWPRWYRGLERARQ